MLKRQLIIDALDGKLKAIKVNNGYLTNAGEHVYAWRDEPLQPQELPAIVYYDRIASLRSDGPLGIFRWTLAVDIHLYVSAGPDTPAQMRLLVADALKAIGEGDANHWDGYAIMTMLAADAEIDIERRGQTAGEAVLNIAITYDTSLWEC